MEYHEFFEEVRKVAKQFGRILLKLLGLSDPKRLEYVNLVYISSRAFQRVFSVYYLLAKIGVDTAENESLKVPAYV